MDEKEVLDNKGLKAILEFIKNKVDMMTSVEVEKESVDNTDVIAGLADIAFKLKEIISSIECVIRVLE